MTFAASIYAPALKKTLYVVQRYLRVTPLHLSSMLRGRFFSESLPVPDLAIS
jgi:hypothetical protein